MEYGRTAEPFTTILRPHIQNLALQYANLFFDDAYEKQPFERITIEDMDALIGQPAFIDILHCVGGGGQGKEILNAFKQYNQDRRNRELALKKDLRATDPTEVQAQKDLVRELHERPKKTPTPEVETMF